MKRWLSDCIRYTHQKLLPREVWHQAEDNRKHPEIRPGTLWMTMLSGMLMQVPSMEQLGRLGQDGLKKVLPRGQRAPSVDTLRDGLDGIALGQLKATFVHMMKRVKEMKVTTTLGGFRVVAIDGMHHFSSTLHKCEDCLKTKLGYDHAGVFCHSVSGAPRLFWGYEPVHRGEGEVTAARRLVDWMFTHFKHFADVIVVDAGFAKAPFLHHLKARGYHFVVRLKDERMRIVQDAMGLFGMAPPDQALVEVKGIHGCRVRIWEETFDTWETMGPLRVVYVEEEMLSGPYEGRTQRILVGTDLSPQEASADMVRKMIHHRWVIENTGFHEGKGRFHLDHAYVHTATAIQAVTWFQLMAMNIYQLYFRHHLTEPRRKGYSSMEVAERMKGELLYGDKHRLRRAFSLGWSPG